MRICRSLVLIFPGLLGDGHGAGVASLRCMHALAQPGKEQLREVLKPLGEFCANMPDATGRVQILDETWGGAELFVHKEAVLEYRITFELKLVPLHELPCDNCVPVRICLNVPILAAFMLLLFDLGVTSVLYSRRPGKIPLVKGCGRFGDWRDALDQVWASTRAAHVLQGWLRSAVVAHIPCPRTLLPSVAMDAEVSDKGSNGHYYTRLYDQLMWPNRCLVNDVLEVGIGSMDDFGMSSMARDNAGDRGYRPGASLRAWLNIFPWANVTGLDIDPRVLGLAHKPWRRPVPGRRLRTFAANTMNRTRVAEALRGMSFDFIVDDGFHKWKGQRATMRNLWPHLRQGGLYVIEDAETSTAIALAAEIGGVAIGTSSWAWLVMAEKKLGPSRSAPPLNPVRMNLPRGHFNICWSEGQLTPKPRLPRPTLADEVRARQKAWRCCGGDGIFPSWLECGVIDEGIRDHCCMSYYLVSRLFA